MNRSELSSDVLAVGAVLTTGAVAGLMFGVGLAAYANKDLPEAAWIMQQQSRDKLFGRIMPSLSISTAISLIAAATLSRPRVRWWLVTGFLLAGTSNILTLTIEVPLNKKIAGWTPDAPPPGWKGARGQWLSNHIVRAIPAVLSFGCAAAGVSQR